VTDSTVDAAIEDLRQLGLLALLDVLSGRPGERPEDVLLDLNLVDGHALALALALRSGRRFFGLRRVTPDHRLFLYLPLHLAQRERVVPLSLAEGQLRVASAYLDPDLGSVTERFPSIELDLVVSPRDEVLEALQRVGA
jgi:Type II secretion system (T2SS), protein E, N-terminal domain